MTKEVKKNDSDLSYVLIVCGIFSIALLIIDFTYSNMHALLESWIRYPFIIAHAAILVLWIVVINGIDNPNIDKYRKILLAVNIAALLLILGHRAGFVSEKMFQDDIKPKQEVNNGN